VCVVLACATPGGGNATGAGGSISGQGGGSVNAISAVSDGSGGTMNCATAEAKVVRDPIDMVFVLDRSASMGGKWSKTVKALTELVKDEVSAGVFVGVNFIPHPSDEKSCNPSLWSPPTVKMGELPGHAATVISGLNSVTVGGDTPTYGALKGTYDFAVDRQKSNGGRKVVVVFGSDGDPCCGACPVEDLQGIGKLAAEARVNSNIDTYVIAIEGSVVANLDKIASAGGTGKAIDLTTNIDSFSAKLQDIRNSALGCSYDIPTPKEGSLDPALVNVVYYANDKAVGDTIAQAADEKSCDAKGGWFYDVASAPKQIVLCPSSCATVQSNKQAQVKLVFGCKTIIK
jgi:hypothetical protein